MGQQREQHVVLPAGIFPHFIVRHPEFRFPFLKTLFNRPPDATEPDQCAKRDTGWRIADRAAIPAHSHGTSVSHVSYMVCEGMDQAFCLDAYHIALKRRGPMGGAKQGPSVL